MIEDNEFYEFGFSRFEMLVKQPFTTTNSEFFIISKLKG